MTRPRFRCVARVVIALVLVTEALVATERQSYNTHYRFPVSVGIEYQMPTPFSAFSGQFNVYRASLQARVPIRFGDLGTLELERWSQTYWYGALELTAAHRFAKSFEAGAGALAGQGNLLLELGTSRVLDPSHSFSIEVRPNVKYLMSLGLLNDYDGSIFGIGFSDHFRFGTDADAAQVIIRSVRLDAEVFNRVGSTPLTAEVIASYKLRQRPVEQRQSVSCDLHDMTALAWNHELQFGMHVFHALGKVEEYAHLAKRSGDDTARAADKRDPRRSIIFVEEGE